MCVMKIECKLTTPRFSKSSSTVIEARVLLNTIGVLGTRSARVLRYFFPRVVVVDISVAAVVLSIGSFVCPSEAGFDLRTDSIMLFDRTRTQTLQHIDRTHHITTALLFAHFERSGNYVWASSARIHCGLTSVVSESENKKEHDVWGTLLRMISLQTLTHIAGINE